MKRKHDLDFILKAIDMSHEKGSKNKVAQELGINLHTLYSWRFAHEKGKLTNPKYNLDFKLKAISMSNETGSISIIAQQLGISKNTLANWRSAYINGKLTGEPDLLKLRKKYSINFKLNAIAMSQGWGSINTTCQHLGITKNNLKHWRKIYRKGLLIGELPIVHKKHSLDFKLKAIAMSNGKNGINTTIKELGITKSTLKYWRQRYREGKLTDIQSISIVKSRKKYSLQFKLDAIAMSNERGSIDTIAQQFKITKSTLNSWRARFRSGKLTGGPSIVKSRKIYSSEFKLKAIAMCFEWDSCIAIANSLNIEKSLLMSWKQAYREGRLPGELPVLENCKDRKLGLLYESIQQRKKIKQLTLEQKILDKISQYPAFKNLYEKYQFISENKDTFKIRKMCSILKINQISYHHWLKKKPSQKALHKEMLLQEIKKIYSQHKGRYGVRRITKELHMSGITASQLLVGKIMRSSNLARIPKKKYKITTNSTHQYLVSENRLTPKYIAVRQNEVWVSDITYIRINPSGWLYLTIILDLFDRKIIGWSLSHTLKAKDTIMEAFKRAVRNRPVQNDFPLIFHSDRGVQYACHEFISELKRHKSILQSMSRKGASWENAVAESFFSSLKTELVYQTTYNSKEEAQQSIVDYIENYYNTNRRHSGLNNLTITEFRKLLGL